METERVFLSCLLGTGLALVAYALFIIGIEDGGRCGGCPGIGREVHQQFLQGIKNIFFKHKNR